MNLEFNPPLLNPSLARPNPVNTPERDSSIIWLDKNENLDSELLKYNHDKYLQIPMISLSTYPESGKVYKKLAGLSNCNFNNLLLTPGSDGAIRYMFEAFVKEGSVVLHTNPTFAMYPVYCSMFGAKSIQVDYELKENQIKISVEKIIENILNYKPALVCIPNPDSPTGTVLPKKDLIEILNTCEKVNSVLLIDEAYYPFYEESLISEISNSKHLFIARTFAKAWGLAGLRAGYCISNSENIPILQKLKPMYEINTLAIELLNLILESDQHVKNSVERMYKAKKYFGDQLENLGFRILQTHGNFIHVNFGNMYHKITEELKDKVYYRVNFNHPALMGYSRFSIGDMSAMETTIGIIKKAIK
ncbi:MAG: histidinol-phosphate aminotransferase family protein [Leptospiraceae bacterium]|nr:histidinol-phosphate aminotransferase family protein [Leptospiraceae bacterium]